jgi:hypothetical protein
MLSAVRKLFGSPMHYARGPSPVPLLVPLCQHHGCRTSTSPWEIIVGGERAIRLKHVNKHVRCHMYKLCRTSWVCTKRHHALLQTNKGPHRTPNLPTSLRRAEMRRPYTVHTNPGEKRRLSLFNFTRTTKSITYYVVANILVEACVITIIVFNHYYLLIYYI